MQKEEEALRALELQREKEAKRNRQDETKACLDYSLKLKMKKKVGLVNQATPVSVHAPTRRPGRCRRSCPWT